MSSDSDKSSFREEFHAAKQTKYDKKFSIRLDQAFKEDSHPAAINCSDIKKKPTPQISIKKNKENNDNLISPRELMVSKEEYIASIREKSRSPRRMNGMISATSIKTLIINVNIVVKLQQL